MKRIIAMLLALAMVFALCACGSTDTNDNSDDKSTANDDVKTLVVGIDPEYPPYAYMGDDGEYTGFDVEVARAVCDLLGWNIEFFALNWDQKLVQLDSNECDCIWAGMTILDSMKKAGYVISDPYYDNTQVLLVKSDSGYSSSKDLAGKTVAVQLGTSGESLLDGDLADLKASFGNVVTCNSFLSCFTELDGGSVDAVFVDYPVAASYVAENEGFSIIDENLGAEQYGIAFRSGDQELCDQIQDAIDQLVENGTYKTIADKYPDIENNLIFLNK